MFKYLYRNFRFGAKELGKNILKALFSSFGILFLIAFLMIYISLRTSVKDFVTSRIFGTLNINEIVISPKEAKGDEMFSGGSATIDSNVVAKIKKMPELTNVYSIVKLDYKTRLKIELLGYSKKPYVPVFGIDGGFFKGKNPQWKSFKNSETIPIIVPKLALEIFNNMAAMTNFPQLTEKNLIGLPINLIIKTPTAEGKDTDNTFPAYMHSFTGDLNTPAVLVPMEFLTQFTKAHSKDTGKYEKGYSYIKLFAVAKSNKDLPVIASKIKKYGLDVESQADIAAKTDKAIKIIDAAFMFIGAVLLILTVIAIFNSYLTIVYNRSYTFSLQRVLGVSKPRIILSFLFESAVIGTIYGAIGFFVGRYMNVYLATHLSQWVPVLKGVTLAPVGFELLPKAVIISIVISCSSALLPAIFASNKSLFKAVSK